MPDIIPQSRELISDFKVHRLVLNPNQWIRYPNRILLNWERTRFDHNNLSTVPDDQVGVYSFVVMPGIANHPACAYVLYVGKVEPGQSGRSFRQRYYEYILEQRKEKRLHIHYMLNVWKDHLWFFYASINQFNQIDRIEKDLLEAYMPPFNKDYKGTIVHNAMKVAF